MKKVFAVVSLGWLVLLGGIAFLYFTPVSDPNDEAITEEEMREIFANALDESHLWALENTEDEEFMAYTLGSLNERCPFYVPDGITYRECLSDYIDEIAVNTSAEKQLEIQVYCEEIAAYITGTEYANLVPSCMAYHLELLIKGETEKMYQMRLLTAEDFEE